MVELTGLKIKMAGGEGSSPPFRQSPYSPFPFGSSLGMSDRTAANSSTTRPRSSLNIGTSTPALASTSTMSTTLSNSLLKGGRVRVQEAYGGKYFLTQI